MLTFLPRTDDELSSNRRRIASRAPASSTKVRYSRSSDFSKAAQSSTRDHSVPVSIRNDVANEEMRALYPDSADYLAVYEKYGLVGPKFSGGHGVWLSDDEFRRLSASGGAITFCPCSNLFLGSGLFRLGRATDPARRVRLSFGTDVGGGNRFSMLNVLDDAYKIGMANNAMLDDPAEAERNKLSAYRGFWSITLGGAEGLYIDDLVGNFAPGKEADFVVLDCNGGPPALAWRQSLIAEDGKLPTLEQAADLLFGLMTVGDDRAIEQTWAMGRQVYLRRGSN